MTHRAYKWLITSLVIVIVAIGMVGIALAQTPDVSKSTQASNDKIEAALATKLAASSADYIVKFKEQADLSPAYKMGWDERGQFVYDTLRNTADRTQAGAKAVLDGMKLRHQTFIAGNELYVFAGNLEFCPISGSFARSGAGPGNPRISRGPCGTDRRCSARPRLHQQHVQEL